jgi:hypothetical protein
MFFVPEFSREHPAFYLTPKNARKNHSKHHQYPPKKIHTEKVSIKKKSLIAV